jgi:predicted nucleic acid-binding Zn ribbon protein
MKTQQGDTGAPDKNEIVRCNSCRAAISGIVSRCPYCGQRTTGAEQKITQLELSMSARMKASERRLRSQCKVCGKATLPDTPLCAKCEAKDRIKTKIIFAVLIVAVIIGLYLFAKYL